MTTVANAVACAVPFAETQAASSPCGGCDSPPGNPGGGGYCIPGENAPLPTPGHPYPTPAPGSPSVMDMEPGEPEEPEGESGDIPSEDLIPSFPCIAIAFPVVD